MRILADKHVRSVAYGIGLLFFFIIMFGYGIYQYQWQGAFVYRLSGVVPYPAILVDWEIVSYHTYLDDYRTLRQYWDFQRENTNVLLGIPSDDEIRDRLSSKLINEKLVAIWARKNGISLTIEEVGREWGRLMEGSATEEDVIRFLDTAYSGWSEDRFKDRVLVPFLLQQKVKHALIALHQQDDETLRERALQVYEAARDKDRDFSELARAYSEDAHTAAQGGELGYFSRGTLESQLEQTIFSMQIGEISEPIKTSFGYHIVKLDDLLYDDAGVAIQASARHILIKSFDFEEWLAAQNALVLVYRLVE